MLKLIATRMAQGCRTMPFPPAPPALGSPHNARILRGPLPARFRGRPTIDSHKCRDGCRACADACPTQAMQAGDGGVRLDLGRCLFCQECVAACPQQAITYTADYRLAATQREGLVLHRDEIPLVQALAEKSRRLFGRSLQLREVCAGSCNGCELELQALNNVVFDLGRFGIRFVASPRHADGLIVTGPVTRHMRTALLKTYAAVPSPKLVIATGACAISGGPFRDGPQVHNGADTMLPVDLYIPGCPPHPLTILDGLLRLLGRLEADRSDPASAAAVLGQSPTCGLRNSHEGSGSGPGQSSG